MTSTWFNTTSNELVKMARNGQAAKAKMAHEELSRLREIWWCTMWQIARDTTETAKHIQ